MASDTLGRRTRRPSTDTIESLEKENVLLEVDAGVKM